MTDLEVFDRLVEQMGLHLFVPEQALRDELRTWTVEKVWHHGACIGAILRRGPELHFATFTDTPITRRIVAEALRPQLEQFGYVETRTPRTAARQHRFNALMGFRIVRTDDYDVHYRMEKRECRLLPLLQ